MIDLFFLFNIVYCKLQVRKFRIMKHAPVTDIALHMPAGLALRLQAYRDSRKFCPRTYVDQKAKALSTYMRSCCLSSLVVGVSGGVDSALVLAIAARTANVAGLDLVPAFIPSHNDGASGQTEALNRVKDLDVALGTQTRVVDMTFMAEAAKMTLSMSGVGTPVGWSSGQSVPYLRTALLYTMTALCADRQRPGILLGTNNFDEGAFIGYFGKASDGMVDVQMLSDIHKSEVYAAGRYMGVPDSILNVVPTGDMFDGRTDVEVLGAGYDYVELHHAVRAGDVNLEGLSPEDLDAYAAAAANLNSLHGHNAHKYAVGSPAIHLDLPQYRPTQVPGDWKGNLPDERIFA